MRDVDIILADIDRKKNIQLAATMAWDRFKEFSCKNGIPLDEPIPIIGKPK